MATTGSPAVSLYTNQTVSDPAALSMAILSATVAAGQTSAPLMATSQPPPHLASVPVDLHPATSQKPLQSASSLEAAAEEGRAVDSSALDSQLQVDGWKRLSEQEHRKKPV